MCVALLYLQVFMHVFCYCCASVGHSMSLLFVSQYTVMFDVVLCTDGIVLCYLCVSQ